MTEAEEIVVLRRILKRAKSATWWARLHYPDGLRGQKNWWTKEESAVLKRAMETQ